MLTYGKGHVPFFNEMFYDYDKTLILESFHK